jgi:hypothetical protein
MSRARDIADLAGSADAGGLTGRSMLINGAFQIWQRGTSAITVSGDDDFTADRFKGWANGGGTFTVEQSTDVPNNEFEFSAKLTNTVTDSSVAAGDDYRWATDIEGYNVFPLAYGSSDAKTATLSFWVKSSLAGTYCGAFYSTTASRHYIYEYTISSADTWEYKTITIDGDTTGSWNRTNGNGLRIYWGFGSGSDVQGTADAWAAGEKWETTNQAAWIGSASATFFITGIKLEIGQTATPFEHRIFGDELAMCQRYYQQYLNPPLRGTMSAGSAASRAGMILPVPMRATPSVTMTQTGSTSHAALFNGAASYTISSIQASYLADFCIEFDFNLASAPAAATPAALYQSSTLQSKFAVSAEL